MMPSRGLNVVARARAPRLLQSQCRNLSTAPRPHLRTASHSLSFSTRTSQPWARSIPATIPSIAAFRYASTAQSQPAAASNPVPPASTDANSFPNLDTITLDDINVTGAAGDIASIPEGIGYLKQIGLDYGWGITSSVEWIFEHIHIWAGLPWWGSIIATGVVLRLAMFPLFLRSSDALARQTAIASVTKPLSDRIAKARQDGDSGAMIAASNQMMAIRKRAGISFSAQFMPMIAQGVLGYCGFKLMRACALLPVPGFHDGGFLWLQDLTMTDGYLILPAIMAAVMHLVFRLGGETGAQNAAIMTPFMRNMLLYGMPVFLFGVTSFQPGAVALWFASTGAIGIAQGQLLQRAAVRKFFGLAPLYKPKPGEASGSLFEFMKKDNPQASSPARPGSPGGAKNTLFMNPTYQSPNLKSQDGRTIDTKLASSKTSKDSTSSANDDMIQPNAPAQPKKGVFDSITEQATSLGQSFRGRSKPTPEQEKKAWKKKADAYEEKAKSRGR